MTRPLWTRADAAAATDGQARGADWAAGGVSIDSRTVAPGDLFVALRGERHDGHGHVGAALAAGAAAALVERVPAGLAEDAPLLVVADALAGLGRLGAAARARSSARIVAVTGSVGKTSTKEALRLALGRQGPTHASVKSFNNQFGVPLTLARMPADAAFGVFEIGMNHAGEISPLVRLVRPHVAMITTVEAVHVENFPDNGIDGVAAAKAEIFEGAAGGTAVLNRDNRYFDFLDARARANGIERVVSFGRHAGADAHLVEFEPEGGGSRVSAVIHGRALIYRIGAPGEHWVLNSLAVLAAVAALDADVAAAGEALADMVALGGRGRQHRLALGAGSYVLIDDSYNASPTSVRASLAVLAAQEIGTGGRRIAVLGDMLELGPESPRLHAELAPALAAAGIDLVFTCGPLMKHLHDALPAARRGAHAADSAALAPLVAAALQPGDAVAVKGSLGSRMARVVDALTGAAPSG